MKATRTTSAKEIKDFERKSKQRLLQQIAFMSEGGGAALGLD